MAYLALARKWRPQQFDQVVGQEHVSRTLVNAIGKDRLAHAYLFTGPRGIGKTTIARIFAKSINCLESEGPTVSPCDRCASCRDIMDGVSLDVLEIDAASNRGIDEIRDLRQSAQFAPAVSRYKVYIVDEVHMLTREAFNALLKILEEPPAHVIFCLATTDPQKLPPTIISRCQRFDLRKLAERSLTGRLREILERDGIAYEDEALRLVAANADGGMRDAESILDQLLAYCGDRVTAEATLELLGLVPARILAEVAAAVASGDIRAVLSQAAEIFNQGWSIPTFTAMLVSAFRDLLVFKASGDEDALAVLPAENARELSERFRLPQLEYILEELLRFSRDVRFTLSERVALEMVLVRLARAPQRIYLEELVERVEALCAGGAPEEDADPPAAAGGKDFGGIWREFLEALGQNRPLHKSYLQLATPRGCLEGVVEVVFDQTHDFHREALEEPKVKQFMEALLGGKLGAPVRLKFTVEEAAARQEAPAGASGGAKAPGKGPDPRRDPAVNRVIDHFKGTVVRVESGR